MAKVLIVLCGCLLFSCVNNSSVGDSLVYIDSVKVFEEFNMKKEYDTILEGDLSGEKSSLDSLKNRIDYYESLRMTKELETSRKEYAFIQNQYSTKFQDLANSYTNKVNEKLNAYLKIYGDSMGYDLIFGVNGSGNIMYSRDTLNITSQVIEFINKSYKN